MIASVWIFCINKGFFLHLFQIGKEDVIAMCARYYRVAYISLERLVKVLNILKGKVCHLGGFALLC